MSLVGFLTTPEFAMFFATLQTCLLGFAMGACGMVAYRAWQSGCNKWLVILTTGLLITVTSLGIQYIVGMYRSSL
jgi:hypothetical protein